MISLIIIGLIVRFKYNDMQDSITFTVYLFASVSIIWLCWPIVNTRDT